MQSGDKLEPREVGVRELRDGLSRHLARVRSGETLTVTDHGRAVARLVPLSGERPLDTLIAARLVTPAHTRKRQRPRPVAAEGPVSDLIAAQRR